MDIYESESKRGKQETRQIIDELLKERLEIMKRVDQIDAEIIELFKSLDIL